MKCKAKSVLTVLLAALMIMTMLPTTAFAASSKKTPAKVSITKVSASTNAVTVKWKKASNATSYRIYYKQYGAKKWIAVANVSSCKTSYTHKTSKKYPLVNGKRYVYTVRAYNKKSKKWGNCNTKGISVKIPKKSVHKHQYNTGVVTKKATCTMTGIKTYTCKTCGNSYTESVPALGHAWHHHDAEGHYETVTVKDAWDETVYEKRYVCNGCGAQFETDDEAIEHITAGDYFNSPDDYYFDDCNNYSLESVPVTVHHDAETKQVYIIDVKAYDECDRCHSTKAAQHIEN